ncbi:MAG TPA: YhjD/YihY/BrkB family envelope integrity protein [Cytophagaceae bacterium]
MTIIEFIKLFPKAFKEWIQDRVGGLSASIAFYQLMSIAPFVSLIVIVSSALFGHQQFKDEIEPLIAQFFHPQFITAIRYMLQYSFDLDESKFLTITVLGIISLVHGTFGFFEQLKDAIETIWNKRIAEANIKAGIRKKAEALFMAMVCFLLLLFGFVAGHWFIETEGVLRYTLMTLIEFIVLFAIIYFLLTYCPPIRFSGRYLLPGALLTTILYMIGRLVLKYVLNHQSEAAQDVAATLLLYLLWAYYSALVFMYGAEFSKLYIRRKELEGIK